MEQLLAYFPLILVGLACPISMGVMMWIMMRGMPAGQKEEPKTTQRIAELEREVQMLRESHADHQPDSVAER